MSRIPPQLAGVFDAPDFDFSDGPANPSANGIHPTNSKFPRRPILSFDYPKSDDPNILLGKDDYLGRGGGMLFVSYAGMGKSSWVIDACMSWSHGEPWVGLKSNGALRILLIQAEDSDRYLGKVVSSYAHVHNLTPAQRETISANFHVVRIKGISGPAFFAELKTQIAEFKPDLVVINPVYMYADGDIGRSEFAQPFLAGLDAVNHDDRFGYLLVHHTGKPAQKGKDGKRGSTEDWESVYMGFGSSFFANWPRCSALLEPVPGKSGSYVLRLGKGRNNAGLTTRVPHGAAYRLEPATSVAIRHSTRTMPVDGIERPIYYWELDDAPTSDNPDEPEIKGGRPKKYTFGQFVDIFPQSPEAAIPRQELYRLALDLVQLPEPSFRNLLYEAVDDGVLLRAKTKRGFVYYLRRQEPILAS